MDLTMPSADRQTQIGAICVFQQAVLLTSNSSPYPCQQVLTNCGAATVGGASIEKVPATECNKAVSRQVGLNLRNRKGLQYRILLIFEHAVLVL